MDSPSINPYSATGDSANAAPRKARGTRGGKRCPNCDAPLDRFKIASSLRTCRCDGCKSKLWLEFGWGLFLANAVLLVAFYALCNVIPNYFDAPLADQNWLRGFWALTCLIWPFGLIFSRILFGYPVAYRNLD
jgi:hypothetical protein